MMIDQMARRASDNLNAVVEQAELKLAAPPTTGYQPLVEWPRVVLAVGSMAAVMVLVGLVAFQLNVTAPDRDLAASTIPDTVAPTVSPPSTPASTPATTLPLPPASSSPTTAPPATTAPTTTIAPDIEAPPIAITSPTEGQVVGEKLLTFRGTTEPGATVTGAGFEADVNADGVWQIVLILNPGGNLATFTATDAAGNSSTASVSVTYQPAVTTTKPPKEDPPEEPPEEPGIAPLIAHAKFGSCEETPPYDIYYGTAEPGATISISSDYGSGSTTANGEGVFEKKVTFAEAPYGVTFLVTVKDNHGNKKTFEFVSWATG